MVAVIVLVLLALPVIGAVGGYSLYAVTGAVVGAVLGTLVAVAIVVLPIRLLVNAEKAKANAPRPPPPDVPWA